MYHYISGRRAHAVAPQSREVFLWCWTGADSTGKPFLARPRNTWQKGGYSTDTMIVQIILGALVGYTMGAIPVGYLVGRAYGVDVRQHGSGRTGGTNVWRSAGITAAALTVVGDALKGLFAVLIARHYLGGEWAAAFAGMGAVVGHNWPIWLGFRGGAGGVVGAATLTGINSMASVIVIPLAVVNLFLTRYASIGTLNIGLGGFLVLLGTWLWYPTLTPFPHVLYGAFLTLAIIWALRPNLKRLREGSERQITIW